MTAVANPRMAVWKRSVAAGCAIAPFGLDRHYRDARSVAQGVGTESAHDKELLPFGAEAELAGDTPRELPRVIERLRIHDHRKHAPEKPRHTTGGRVG